MSHAERKPRPSVVEVMITVVGIIVLVGLAVPAQRGLAVRASVAECVDAASAAQPTGRALLDRLQAVPQCSSVHEAGDGSFVVIVRDERAGVPPVLKLELSTDSPPQPHWRCSQLEGDPRHMPAECRSTARSAAPTAGTRESQPGLQQAARH